MNDTQAMDAPAAEVGRQRAVLSRMTDRLARLRQHCASRAVYFTALGYENTENAEYAHGRVAAYKEINGMLEAWEKIDGAGPAQGARHGG